MNEPKNRKALETGSGITWHDWLEILEPHKELSHGEMAKIALDRIQSVGLSKSPEWWAQGVTVAYEQHIGRRQPGQQSGGKFAVTVSKTINGDMDKVLGWWMAYAGEVASFYGVAVEGAPRISQTDKWRYWRRGLADGSRLSVNIQGKPSGTKSTLTINHDNLSATEDVETWRSFWKSFIDGESTVLHSE